MAESWMRHVQQLVDVASRYYVDGASQADIAHEIHVSRPTVSRLLSEARDSGVVTIRIEHPMRRQSHLERQLIDRFGLTDAWVPRVDSGLPTEAVARCAAVIVADTVRDDSVVAISNGTTLAELIAELEKLPAARHRESIVVPMIGALGSDNLLVDGPDLCRRIADCLGGTYRILPTPLIVGAPRLAAALRTEVSIATTLSLASRADVAVVGIGTCDNTGSGRIFDGWMTRSINQRLLEQGAVGHIAGHHFDAQGRHIKSDLCERTIGIAPERLAEMPNVVAVVAGTNKVSAILGALRGGYIQSLVIDDETAARVLASA